MIRRFSVVATIIATFVGAFFFVPSASAQVAVETRASSPFSCTSSSSGGQFFLNCKRNGHKVGKLVWYGADRVVEQLGVGDQRNDGRITRAHVKWYSGGKWNYANISDGYGDGHYIRWRKLDIKDGTRVHLKLCQSGVGCSPTYKSRA